MIDDANAAQQQLEADLARFRADMAEARDKSPQLLDTPQARRVSSPGDGHLCRVWSSTCFQRSHCATQQQLP